MVKAAKIVTCINVIVALLGTTYRRKTTDVSYAGKLIDARNVTQLSV
jgi:hypothetical protein